MPKSRSIVRNRFLGYRTQTLAEEEDPAEAHEALSNALHIETFYFRPLDCFYTLLHTPPWPVSHWHSRHRP